MANQLTLCHSHVLQSGSRIVSCGSSSRFAAETLLSTGERYERCFALQATNPRETKLKRSATMTSLELPLPQRTDGKRAMVIYSIIEAFSMKKLMKLVIPH